jgi:hypothetical protein
MDVGTGLVLASGAAASKDLLIKLLGPTAEYLGEGTKDIIQKRVDNLNRIFNHSINLLGSKIETEGEVSPRILKHILNEGDFCEDKLTSEYFGGLLASSRTGEQKDDRGLTYLAVVSNMSTYQIRTHYVFYSIIEKLFKGQNFQFSIEEDCNKMRVFLPLNVYLESMGTDKDKEVLTIHSLVGLRRLGLINSYAIGPKETISQYYPPANSGGLLFTPTTFGVELYLWAHGYANTPVNSFLDKENQFAKSELVSIPDGAIST